MTHDDTEISADCTERTGRAKQSSGVFLPGLDQTTTGWCSECPRWIQKKWIHVPWWKHILTLCISYVYIYIFILYIHESWSLIQWWESQQEGSIISILTHTNWDFHSDMITTQFSWIHLQYSNVWQIKGFTMLHWQQSFTPPKAGSTVIMCIVLCLRHNGWVEGKVYRKALWFYTFFYRFRPESRQLKIGTSLHQPWFHSLSVPLALVRGIWSMNWYRRLRLPWLHLFHLPAFRGFWCMRHHPQHNAFGVQVLVRPPHGLQALADPSWSSLPTTYSVTWVGPWHSLEEKGCAQLSFYFLVLLYLLACLDEESVELCLCLGGTPPSAAQQLPSSPARLWARQETMPQNSCGSLWVAHGQQLLGRRKHYMATSLIWLFNMVVHHLRSLETWASRAAQYVLFPSVYLDPARHSPRSTASPLAPVWQKLCSSLLPASWATSSTR